MISMEEQHLEGGCSGTMAEHLSPVTAIYRGSLASGWCVGSLQIQAASCCPCASSAQMLQMGSCPSLWFGNTGPGFCFPGLALGQGMEAPSSAALSPQMRVGKGISCPPSIIFWGIGRVAVLLKLSALLGTPACPSVPLAVQVAGQVCSCFANLLIRLMLLALGCVGHGELVPSHALWCLITVVHVCHCPAMLCEHCAPSSGYLRSGGARLGSPGVPVLSIDAGSALLLPTQSPLLHTPPLQLVGASG